METAGIEPASESPVLQTSTYLVCCSLNFPEHSRQSSWKASLVYVRPGSPGKNRNYPIIDDAIDWAWQEQLNHSELPLIRQPKHTHSCLRLHFFPGGLTRNQDLGMPSVLPRLPSKPVSSPFLAVDINCNTSFQLMTPARYLRYIITKLVLISSS